MIDEATKDPEMNEHQVAFGLGAWATWKRRHHRYEKHLAKNKDDKKKLSLNDSYSKERRGM